MTEYDDPTVELAWEFWWQGYKLGKDVENQTEIAKRTAKSRFERYLEINHDRDAPD